MVRKKLTILPHCDGVFGLFAVKPHVEISDLRDVLQTLASIGFAHFSASLGNMWKLVATTFG